MDVLVTGGMGYIGSALLPLLADAPDVDRIVVLDSLASGSPRHLLEARVDGDLDFRRGDVREYGNVENAMGGVDTVIHLAAITGAASTHDRRAETMAVNLEGTENVVNAARKLDVGNLVFASSCNNYGRAATTDIDETTEPDPLNPYAEAKVAAENIVAEFAGANGANATSLRMSTNYGFAPGVRFNLVVNHFVFRALTGRPLTVYGDGRTGGHSSTSATQRGRSPTQHATPNRGPGTSTTSAARPATIASVRSPRSSARRLHLST